MPIDVVPDGHVEEHAQATERAAIESGHAHAGAPAAQMTAAQTTAEQFETEVAEIVELYREAGRALRAGEPADFAGHITMPQLRVLYFLSRQGASSVGEVAAGVGVAQPSATETLDKLVRAGLVERLADPNDRRVVRTQLTAAGRDVTDRPWEARRATLASALRCATPHERAAIADGLALLCRALKRSEHEAQAGEGESPGAATKEKEKDAMKEREKQEKGRNVR